MDSKYFQKQFLKEIISINIYLVAEHATGLEKKELLAIQSGNDNPFDMRVYKRGPGTKDQPTEIPAMLDKRLIGCICDEDSSHINYMWLHKGEPKRCECGYWFKLVKGDFLH